MKNLFFSLLLALCALGAAPAMAQSAASPASEKVYEAVEVPAEFPGGPAEMMKWLSMNIRYPASAQENGAKGRVIVRFIVEKDGKVSSPTILTGVDEDLDREALRVVRRMPEWTPAKQHGKAVRSYYTLPIIFNF